MASDGSLEVLLSDADNTIARGGTVVFQIRVGTMTHDGLARIEQALRLSRAQHGGVEGALVVIEDTAEVPPSDVRAAQRALVQDLLADPRIRIAIVIPGSGVKSLLARTILRTAFSRHNLRFCATVDEGSRWIADPHAPADRSAQITAMAERARSIARARRREG